ncbi:MAG: hypothetical protein NVV63_06375 [Opitutus sp.]|nr:hypothetical protein [Opitutus sp.]
MFQSHTPSLVPSTASCQQLLGHAERFERLFLGRDVAVHAHEADRAAVLIAADVAVHLDVAHETAGEDDAELVVELLAILADGVLLVLLDAHAVLGVDERTPRGVRRRERRTRDAVDLEHPVVPDHVIGGRIPIPHAVARRAQRELPTIGERAETFFVFAFGGDVAARARDAKEFAVGIALHDRARLDVAHGAVGGADHAELVIEEIAAVEHEIEAGGSDRAIVRVDALEPALVRAVELARLQAVDRVGAFVPGIFLRDGIPFPNAERGRLCGELQTLVERAQVLLGEAVRGDVGENADPVGQLAGGVVHRLHVHDLPIRVAALRVVEDLDVAAFAGLLGAAQLRNAGGIGFGPLEKMAGLAAFHLGERVTGHALERGVGPLDATLSIAHDHAVGGVARDEAELEIFAGGGAEIGAQRAQLVGAAGDQLLKTRGLLLEDGVEARVFLLRGFAPLVDFHGHVGREKRQGESAEQKREQEKLRRQRQREPAEAHQCQRKNQQRRRQDRHPVKQPPRQRSGGARREQNAKQFGIRPGDQRTHAQDHQSRGRQWIDRERPGVRGDPHCHGHDQGRGAERENDHREPHRRPAAATIEAGGEGEHHAHGRGQHGDEVRGEQPVQRTHRGREKHRRMLECAIVT